MFEEAFEFMLANGGPAIKLRLSAVPNSGIAACDIENAISELLTIGEAQTEPYN